MDLYRKSDEYYADEYDRITIERLKELEAVMLEAEKQYNLYLENPDSINHTPLKVYIGTRHNYNDTGIHYARQRRSTIDSWITRDEKRDQLLRSNPTPSNVRCNVCDARMKFEMHDFLQSDFDLVFFFSCPDGHLPMKILYPNGTEHFVRKHACKYCGGDLISTKKRTKHKITFKDKCKVCDKTNVVELDIKSYKIIPITDEDRKKYCMDFQGRRTFEESLKALAYLSDLVDEHEEKNKYEFKKVQRLNIAQLEQILTEDITKCGFIKIQFDKPKSGRYLTMDFSVQDPTDRESSKSAKELKKAIDQTLFKTNWRLTSPGIDYKLGFLSGQLKGYSLDEDILKIAQEIWRKEHG